MNKAIKEYLINKLKADMYSLQLQELSTGVLFRQKVRSTYIQFHQAIFELEQLKTEEGTTEVEHLITKQLKGTRNETDHY